MGVTPSTIGSYGVTPSRMSGSGPAGVGSENMHGIGIMPGSFGGGPGWTGVGPTAAVSGAGTVPVGSLRGGAAGGGGGAGVGAGGSGAGGAGVGAGGAEDDTGDGLDQFSGFFLFVLNLSLLLLSGCPTLE